MLLTAVIEHRCPNRVMPQHRAIVAGAGIVSAPPNNKQLEVFYTHSKHVICEHRSPHGTHDTHLHVDWERANALLFLSQVAWPCNKLDAENSKSSTASALHRSVTNRVVGINTRYSDVMSMHPSELLGVAFHVLPLHLPTPLGPSMATALDRSETN